MRRVFKPLLSGLFDTLLLNARNPLPKSGGLVRERSVTACIRCQIRGISVLRGGKCYEARGPNVKIARIARRWQSSSDKPVAGEGEADPTSDGAVEERMRRAKEEYTMRELRARRPVPKIETPKPLLADAPTSSQPSLPTATEPAPPSPPPPPRPSNELPLSRSAANETSSTSRIPYEQLPSHNVSRRSELLARFYTNMERLMSNINIASQRVNTYTGTDYSGISALRAEIIAQERLVKASLQAVTAAKDAHAAAFTAQAASQKEVVQLLERKHSWSATDLERYMILIRSEHVNEQAVQAAKDDLGSKERALEDVRAGLEKSERRLYHEEQIWSDTIRRNSTWVTFGLMGFNVILLLASLLLFEPWRRRRMVREIRSALDEKTLAPALPAFIPALASAQSKANPASTAEPAVNASSAPISEPLEDIKSETSLASPTIETLSVDASGPEAILVDPSTNIPATSPPFDPSEPDNTSSLPLPATSASPAETPTPTAATPLLANTTSSPLPDTPIFSFPLWADTWTATWALYKAYWADLFSERRIALRKVDLTATALEGAAAGAACMGLLFVLLRPR